MRQIRYQDRNDTVVETLAVAEPSTPDQLRRFAVDQLVSAIDPAALEAVRRYSIRNRI